MSDLEEQEYLQDRQHRFEAALRLWTTPDKSGNFMELEESVRVADALLARLEETRTKS